MAISFSSSSLDFGNVVLNQPAAQQFTISNSGTSPVIVTLTPPTGYSVDPSSVSVAASGTATVSVTFTPTAAKSYSGTLSGTSSSDTIPSCTLSGTGTASGIGSNLFEAEDAPSVNAADIGSKYYQVAVPNFGLNNTTTAANTFVRLGSFPSLTDTTKFPPGFQSSLNLANLVGDATKIAAAETGIDTVPGGFSDGSGLPSPYDGKGDSNYLLGFADDTRLRGADAPADTLSNAKTISQGKVVSNSATHRKAETASLLTKGGWWDHSDGNRVTTTSGDKVEVIQGNYKLVVLGRQPLVTDTDAHMATLVGNAFITDVSGGHFQEQYPSPTPCIKTIEYSQDGATGEWTLYQDNGIGNLITKLAGRTVDMFQGSSRETYVGKDPKDVGRSDSPDTSLDPVITSRTWAQRIMTYVGSVDKPVQELFTLTFAHAIQDIKFVTANLVSTTTATTITSTNIAGDIFTMNVAPFIQTINAVAREVDLKLGTYFAYGTNTTHVRGSSTTFEGNAEVATVTKDKLTAIDTSISNAKNDIRLARVSLQEVHTDLTNTTTKLGTVEARLHTANILGF